MRAQKLIPKNQEEMNLLDKFAADTMKALIMHHGAYCDDSLISAGSEDVFNIYEVSDYAYNQAEAMLEVRKHRYNW